METTRPSYARSAYETIKEITILLLIVFMIRTYVFGLYQVPSGSMEKTMFVGERFLGEKFSYLLRKPCAGEVVAFNAPTYPYASNPIHRLFQEYVLGPDNWTKRVIGVPGDHLKGVIENGCPVIYRNGEKLHEPYVNDSPLVYVLPAGDHALRAQIAAELLRQDSPVAHYSPDKIDELVTQLIKEHIHILKDHCTPKSYNPDYSIEAQPWYRMKDLTLLADAQGNIVYEMPNTPLTHHDMEINTNNPNQKFNGSDEFDIHLGADEYWLMGDNRLGSTDSRFIGPIAGRLIHGRIVFRIWSIDSDASWWLLDLIRNPIDFWSRIRWNRFFQIIT